MSQIRIKTSQGWKKVVGNTASHYHQDEEPTEAVAGDIWMTDEAGEPLLQKIYDMTFPVGSTKVCLNSSDIPVVPEGVSATWELDNTYNGKSLWVDNTQDVGTSMDGSLPNIQGTISPSMIWKANNATTVTGSGAFKSSSDVMGTWTDESGDSHKYGYAYLVFKASDSNSVYGASAGTNVVRPTSVTVKVYKRTA